MTNWKKLEAVLFASGKYLPEERLMSTLSIDKRAFNKAIKELKEHYEKIDSSLKLFNENDTWKLNVKEEYVGIIASIVSDLEFSKPVMETLALIAYRAPVLQSDIIDIRGVTAYDHIGFLEDKKFITRERSGRSYKIKVAEKFHEYFDVDDEKLQRYFKEIKEPEMPKMGDLDVYDTKTDDETFESNLEERMKKPEPVKKDEEEDFLNNIDNKIEGVKGRLDEHESEEIILTEKEDDTDKTLVTTQKVEGENSEETDKVEDLFEQDVEGENSEEVLKKVNSQIEELVGEEESKKDNDK